MGRSALHWRPQKDTRSYRNSAELIETTPRKSIFTRTFYRKSSNVRQDIGGAARGNAIPRWHGPRVFRRGADAERSQFGGTRMLSLEPTQSAGLAKNKRGDSPHGVGTRHGDEGWGAAGRNSPTHGRRKDPRVGPPCVWRSMRRAPLSRRAAAARSWLRPWCRSARRSTPASARLTGRWISLVAGWRNSKATWPRSRPMSARSSRTWPTSRRR